MICLRKRLFPLIIAFALLVSACSAADGEMEVTSAGDGKYVCVFDGVRHDLIVDLPEKPEGSPLILMLHGYGNTAESFRLQTKLQEEACPRGYTVAYVTGAPDPEDRTSANGWDIGAGNSSGRDTAFLTALTDHLQKRFGLNRSRLFAVGFSNGGFMAHRLAAEAGDVFAAVVSVAGTMSGSVWEERPDRCRTGFLQITGEKDGVVPKNSDGSAGHSPFPAIEDVISYYAEANGLDRCGTEKAGKASSLTKYSSDTSDRQVWHLVVKDGRHSWPAEDLTGIDTNRLILDFLDGE